MALIKIKINKKIPKIRAPHKPTKAHSTKKGKKGYDRRKAKDDLKRT